MHGSDRVKESRWVMLQTPGWNTATLGVAAMILVQLAVIQVWRSAGDGAVERIYFDGGLSLGGISAGMVWQFFTHAWLHGSWSHLISNALLFYYAAARLSHVLSGKRIFVLFLISSVGSGIAHVAAQVIFPALAGGILVGASGGIMGMLFGYFALSPGSRMLFLPISAKNLAKGFLISSAFLFLVTPALEVPLMADLGRWLAGLLGQEIFQWAHLAHFVGALLGWVLIDRFFPKLLTREDLERMRAQDEISAELRRGMVDPEEGA